RAILIRAIISHAHSPCCWFSSRFRKRKGTGIGVQKNCAATQQRNPVSPATWRRKKGEVDVQVVIARSVENEPPSGSQVSISPVLVGDDCGTQSSCHSAALPLMS